VPKSRTFLRQNHDLIKFWLEEIYEEYEDRFSFLLRLMRLLCSVCPLFIVTFWMHEPKDSY
jgi:hypothetical protein